MHLKKVVIVLVLSGVLVGGAAPLSSVGAQEGPYKYRVPIFPYPPYNGGTYDIPAGEPVYFTFGWGSCVPPDDLRWRDLLEDYPPETVDELLALIYSYFFGPFEAFRYFTYFRPFRLENTDTGDVLVKRISQGAMQDYYLPDLRPSEYDSCLNPLWEHFVMVWEYPVTLDPGTYYFTAEIFTWRPLTDWGDVDADGQFDVFYRYYWEDWYPDHSPYTATIIVYE